MIQEQEALHASTLGCYLTFDGEALTSLSDYTIETEYNFDLKLDEDSDSVETETLDASQSTLFRKDSEITCSVTIKITESEQELVLTSEALTIQNTPHEIAVPTLSFTDGDTETDTPFNTSTAHCSVDVTDIDIVHESEEVQATFLFGTYTPDAEVNSSFDTENSVATFSISWISVKRMLHLKAIWIVP